MPPKSQGESKQGLIITLVFFILATIGLGVATYFGFADQEVKDKAVIEAKKQEGIFKAERDWYRFQAEMYRSYLGHAENVALADLGVKKGQFDQGAMKIEAYKDKENVSKLMKDFDKRLGWNAKENKPEQTFETLLDKAKKDYEQLEKRNQGLQKDLADTKTTVQKREEELASAKEEYKKNLDKFKNEGNTDQDGNRKTIDDLRNEITRLGGERENDKKKAEADRLVLVNQMKKKDTDIKFRDERIKAQAEQISQYQVKSSEAPASMRTDWKIVKMDLRGTNPYINLGSADRVKPQLTFSIHGVGLDGRPNAQPKGTLEVVNVVGDHLSRTRITSVKDPNRDPILEGDVLYNPSWNPNLMKHVAVAGLIDLTGNGSNSLPEFIRNLERQNIIVDAWLDPKDGSIKGKGITVRTDYLIIGESLEFSEKGRDKGGDPKTMELGRKQMEAQAAKNGVGVVALHKYLEMIGYRLPRSMGEERPSLYNSSLRPSGERRGNKPPPAMPPDK